MASLTDSQEIFNNLLTKITQLLFGRTENDRTLINKTLDDLNALDYRYPLTTNNTKSVLLINRFCTLVPPDDSVLVAKCCGLISCLIKRQHVVVEGRTLSVAIDWILQALKQAEQVVRVDVLVTLDALLRSNTQNIYDLVPIIVIKNGPLLGLALDESKVETALLAVQCLEACCDVPENYKSLNNTKCYQYYETCAQVFLKYLLVDNSKVDNFNHSKLLISCVKGLQNIIIQYEDFLHQELGLLLGICKSYMVYQLNGIGFAIPQKLMPSALSIPEPSPNKPWEKKGGKVTKQRKQRLSAGSHKNKKADNDEVPITGGYVPATATLDVAEDNPVGQASRLKTSDSDFSDTETGRSAKVSIMEGRLRQAALHLLLNICKLVEKRLMFSYWSSFIPDTPMSSSHSLTNCILKDPSPRGRMAALNVLLSLLASSKLYLSQAEYSDRVGAFTPFSVTLGRIIKELHHCLCLALNETSYPVLTQALKCLASLVQATPYHRLGQGLTTKVIRNVKELRNHKDTTVQVAALIVLGCILASEPTVKETQETLKSKSLKKISEPQPPQKPPPISDDFDYADFSSEEETEADDNSSPNTVPWLLHSCVTNLTTSLTSPAPVKLESLQVISAMSRNYFEALVWPELSFVTKALENSMQDNYIDVRLHGGKTVEFVGQAMNQYLVNSSGENVDKSIAFWEVLLNGPLISMLNSEHPSLRTIACDCIGSIGALTFEQLSREKQLLCITLLFTSSRDEDNAVKGSAVRALAISVLYPSLREDTGFIMDTVEAIHRTLNDENMGLRMKSSWSLGNLSDALVINKSDQSIEEVPNSCLLSLLRDGVKGCSDNDKIKCNAVRALGNLLQLIDDELVQDHQFRSVADEAISVLVKCCNSGLNMKVRWNACYALGNVLRNPNLYKIGNNWLKSVFSTLTDLVFGFKNFKVRINAAVALAACPKRELYGIYYNLVWKALVSALENSENMEDFSEYKHRDNLIEQICLSLGHMISIILVEDIVSLKDTFAENALKVQMQRVYDRLVPEKSTVLFSAKEHLLSLKDLNHEQSEVIDMLKNVFSNDLTY